MNTYYDNLGRSLDEYNRKIKEQQKKKMSKKVSKYVSYKEVIFSRTALRNDIDNNPSDKQLDLIIECAKNVFDPLREWVGGPVKINSVFRSKDLNKKIGGSQSSQHSVGLDKSKNSYGAALDLDDTYGHKTNREMFHYIKDNLDWDQIIWEFGNSKNPDWVHVSYRPDGKNRKQILIAKYDKPKYVFYKGNEHLIS